MHREAGTITSSNVMKSWWPIKTQDRGYVVNTEVVTLTCKGGRLLPSGQMGMVVTKDYPLTITSEYAIMLSLKGKLHTAFPSEVTGLLKEQSDGDTVAIDFHR